ncbi:MAG: acyl-CoA thioesterase [Candidatus Zixiibacteriota bacterium]
MSSYTYTTTVMLPATDAAGVVFFANYFALCHDAYESFMGSIGFGFRFIFEQADYLLLIVHAEADYKQPLRVGDKVTVTLDAEEIGRSSFTRAYTIACADGSTTCAARTVHAAVDKKSGRAVRLSSRLSEELASIKQS